MNDKIVDLPGENNPKNTPSAAPDDKPHTGPQPYQSAYPVDVHHSGRDMKTKIPKTIQSLHLSFARMAGTMSKMYQVYFERQRKKLFGTRAVRMKILSALVFAGFIGLIAVTLGTGVLFAWYAKDLPRPDKVVRREGLTTVIEDRNGEKLYDIFKEADRIPAKWEEIPETLKNATIAIEDKEFYSHQGLSPTGIVRGLMACVFMRRCQGGSTLTQQLVKTVLLTQERTLPRKIKEAILAIQIERKYGKNDILLMYLNEVPYGGTAVGVKTAAQHYFSKDLKDLTLVESAILAGLPQSPSHYSPFTGDPEAFKGRTQHVLRRMREDGYINPVAEADAVKSLDTVQFAQGDAGLKAPHFVAYVKELLIEELGEKRVDDGGLTVTTTLDWKLQEAAQKIVKEEVDKAKKLKVSNGAAIVLDPKTGEILAMVGSKDYEATDSSGFKFNVAVQALRQPGSSLKPIIYAAGLSKGYTAATLIMDVDTKYPSGDPAKPEYNPKNYDGKFRGPMLVRNALANSINTVAVKMTALSGIRDILKFGYDMGISTWEPTDENLKRVGLSLALGGAEVRMIDEASAYATFANEGKRTDPVAILKVMDTGGKTLYEYKPVNPRQVVDPEIAYIISSILSDNEARKETFGANSYLRIPNHTVAVKTGTTDDKRDNWTAGYTVSRVAVTWVGNNDNSPMSQSLASGVTGAAPIWNRIMKEALKDIPDEPFVRPGNVTEMDIDAYGGGLPVDGQPVKKEVFIRGTEPTGRASIYQTLKLSRKDSNRLANAIEVATGDYDERNFIVLREEDPVSTDGKNRWQEGIDAWLSGQSDAKYRPPTETYSGGDRIMISFKSPRDRDQTGSTVVIEAEVLGTDDIGLVEVYVDGNRIREQTDKNISHTTTLSDGSHTIRIRATARNGSSDEREIRIGVNRPYEEPTKAPESTATPSPSPLPSPIP